MSLRERLHEILPSLLPAREEDAIKGTELIARVRSVLGDTYSDRSLRSQFSLLALEPDSCLARIANGQGYYLRPEEGSSGNSLHSIFENEADARREGSAPLHKALALAVRLYDTMGLGVFLYPVEDEESWGHPDLVAVQWPAGHRDSEGAYIIEADADAHAPQEATFRAICVGFADSAESCRMSFFRTLACGQWAQETELLLIPGPDSAEVEAELAGLAARYGVGVQLLPIGADTLELLPRADLIFRAETEEARTLLASTPRRVLAQPRHAPPLPLAAMPDTDVVRAWVGRCLSAGRVEAYEQRVAVN